MGAGIEFDWNDENRDHLAVHKIHTREFEEVVQNEPVDMEYRNVHGEDRYRSVGITNTGRVLTIVWTIREGKVRAITAFRATASERRTFLESLQS